MGWGGAPMQALKACIQLLNCAGLQIEQGLRDLMLTCEPLLHVLVTLTLTLMMLF